MTPLLLAQPIATASGYPPSWHGMLAWALWTLFVATGFYRLGKRDRYDAWSDGYQVGRSDDRSFKPVYYRDGTSSLLNSIDHGVPPEEWMTWTDDVKWRFTMLHMECKPGPCKFPHHVPEPDERRPVPPKLKFRWRSILVALLADD